MSLVRIDHVAEADARVVHQFRVGDAPASIPPPALPVAAFSFVADGLSVDFTDASTDADGPIVSWLWDFGDGNSSTAQHPTHEYADDSGSPYTVRLTVTDSGGATDFVEQAVAVSEGVVVPTDGPDGWYRPVSAADFAALGLDAPDYLCLCQDQSGDLVPTIDDLSIGNLVADGAGHGYEETIAGWDAKFVRIPGSAAGQRFSNTALTVGAGESLAILAYISYTTPGVTSRLLPIASSNELIILNTGVPRFQHNGVNANGTVTHGGLTTVRQMVWYRDATGNASGGETSLEPVVNTHAELALTSVDCGIGAPVGLNPCEAKCCLYAVYKGAKAEQAWATYLATLRGE